MNYFAGPICTGAGCTVFIGLLVVAYAGYLVLTVFAISKLFHAIKTKNLGQIILWLALLTMTAPPAIIAISVFTP